MSRLYATSSTGWRRLTPSSRCEEVLEAGARTLERRSRGRPAFVRYVVGDRVSARDHTERWRSGSHRGHRDAGRENRLTSTVASGTRRLLERLRREDVDIDDVSLSKNEEERPSLLKGAVSSLDGSSAVMRTRGETRRLPATGLANLGIRVPERGGAMLSHARSCGRIVCLRCTHKTSIGRRDWVAGPGRRGVCGFAEAAPLFRLRAPRRLQEGLGKCKPQFAGSEQQDSQEFLTVRTRRPSST